MGMWGIGTYKHSGRGIWERTGIIVATRITVSELESVGGGLSLPLPHSKSTSGMRLLLWRRSVAENLGRGSSPGVACPL